MIPHLGARKIPPQCFPTHAAAFSASIDGTPKVPTAVCWGQQRSHSSSIRTDAAGPAGQCAPEVVICPFLPELLPLIPHQDILRPPRNHYVEGL